MRLHTNDYLAKYHDVEVIYSPERRGKTAALNHGLSLVKSELVVMTDANTMLNPESIQEIVRCFMDPKVACVAGEKRVAARHEGQAAAEGEGLYWKYESTLKRWDGELYSAMGAAGELCAIRRSLYEPMPENALLDDFVMSLRMVDKGYRPHRGIETQTPYSCRRTAKHLVASQHDESLTPTCSCFSICFAPSVAMEYNPHCTATAHSTQRSAGIPQGRKYLYVDMGITTGVLSGGLSGLPAGTIRKEKQIALCALLFFIYESECIQGDDLS